MDVYKKHVNLKMGIEYYQYNFEVLMSELVDLTLEQWQEINSMIEDKIEEYGKEKI
jgi:hypothetical protein